MSLYERWVLPTLLDLVMRQRQMQKFRRELIPAARGRVLEVGVGSGLNLPHYASGVTAVVGLDPSRRLLAMAQRRTAKAIAPVELLQGSASEIPLDNDSIDTLVMTWALCSIPDPRSPIRWPRYARCDGSSSPVERYCLSSTAWLRSPASHVGSIDSRRCGGLWPVDVTLIGESTSSFARRVSNFRS
ncbi:MAG: methyltransferase [Rhodospirillaceae bacterium]|nr:MAG: methyltransferase [Rhodospirillaceae bacterium]